MAASEATQLVLVTTTSLLFWIGVAIPAEGAITKEESITEPASEGGPIFGAVPGG